MQLHSMKFIPENANVDSNRVCSIQFAYRRELIAHHREKLIG